MHSRPIGTVTRGTTNPNRLRRQDRWLAGPQGWRLRAERTAPIVVDLGYGASPITALELHERMGLVRNDVRVVGIEIEPSRVALGQALAKQLGREGLSFRRGGFEVPLDGERATVIRAANVLRQYDEADVPAAWARLCERLTPNGIVLEGTCDELGRLSTWVALDRSGPISFTVSYRLGGLADPMDIAPRLVKALIHRNVPGERIHDFLTSLSQAWAINAPLANHGARQRFIASAALLKAQGWPLLDGVHRWRIGELTVRWDAVAPAN